MVVRSVVVIAAGGAAWLAVAHPDRPVRTVAALAAGLLAVPVGVGIGVPHAATTGLSPMTLTGSTLLLGGLGLSALGTLEWCGAGRRRSCVPRVLAVVLLCGLMVWTLGQAVAATNVPRSGLGTRTPADLGLDYHDVAFDAADGVRLSGWYIPSVNGAAAVLLHGAGSTRSDVLEHAGVLARSGYGVLLYDARGHGRSDGRAMDFGWYGDEDIAGAVRFVAGQPDVDATRIGLVGLSMGGEQAIGAAATVAPIAAVVAEGATNRVSGDKSWLSDEFGVRGAVSEAVGALTYWFTDLLTAAEPPITLRDAAQAAAGTPILLIASEVGDEVAASRYIESGSPGSVDLWIAPDGGHTQGLHSNAVAWERRVIDFLDGALVRTPGSLQAG
jgi:pimeloyl-ACP methyl ester carboxylesterase